MYFNLKHSVYILSIWSGMGRDWNTLRPAGLADLLDVRMNDGLVLPKPLHRITHFREARNGSVENDNDAGFPMRGWAGVLIGGFKFGSALGVE